MIRLRTNSVCSWTQVEEKYLDGKFNDLILRICVISGGSYPKTKPMYDAFLSELKVFVSQPKYITLSFDELIFAFRMSIDSTYRYQSGEYVETVFLDSENINIGYISKVLYHYYQLRIGVENLIGNTIDGY